MVVTMGHFLAGCGPMGTDSAASDCWPKTPRIVRADWSERPHGFDRPAFLNTPRRRAADIPYAYGSGPYGNAMSSKVRRKRGTPTEGLYVDVAPDVLQTIDQLSSQLGLPKWAIIEAAIRSARPGYGGVPIGWELPARGEELPIPDVA